MNGQSSENYQRLIEAFGKKSFQNRINQYRYDIEQQLKSFIEWLISELTPSQKIFHSPESRIKSKISFEEKIYRKDYINKWLLNGSISDLQNEILHNLSDLIGFRITCFFMDDEEVIYKKLQEYHGLHRFTDITLDFSEKTVQKNGKRIYKVSGKYKDTASFELQIKAATHSVWGEVEHKTVYKGQQYSINSQERETVTGEIFNILRASDQQLLALFKYNYTQDDLVCGLFAEQTKDKVKDTAKTEYLAGHYTSFFSIFLPAARDNICQYVSAVLSNNARPYIKQELNLGILNDVDTLIVQKIKDCFLEYYLSIQYRIAQELYVFKDYDEFILYMAQTVSTRFHINDDGDDFVEGDIFSENDDGKLTNEEHEKLILEVLADKMPDARKERI